MAAGKAAQKLLERMKASQGGWKPGDFSALYEGFGLQKKEGGNHTLYYHPRYADIRATVPRHRKLKNCYAREAVKIIQMLIDRESGVRP